MPPPASNMVVSNIAPSVQRIVRDIDGSPYQGRVPSGEIPLGYHYVYDFNTWSAAPNPGYQSGQNVGAQNTQNQPTSQLDQQIDQEQSDGYDTALVCVETKKYKNLL